MLNEDALRPSLNLILACTEFLSGNWNGDMYVVIVISIKRAVSLWPNIALVFTSGQLPFINISSSTIHE